MDLLNKIFKKGKSAEKGRTAAIKVKPEKSAGETGSSEKKEKEQRKPLERKEDPTIFRYISEPMITEKATDLVGYNKYCFRVPLSANKTEVGKRIVNLYGVKPEKINFIRSAGKKVRYGRRFGMTKGYKKAIITLRQGDKIEIYEGV